MINFLSIFKKLFFLGIFGPWPGARHSNQAERLGKFLGNGKTSCQNKIFIDGNKALEALVLAKKGARA
jgi:hypothetical protein